MKKVLVANRGEIACRIIKSCRALDLGVVAVYSDADAQALHVELADEAHQIGPPKPQESYLRGEAVIAAAKAAGADAVHPGYGFLAENAVFARAVAAAGVPILPGSPRFAEGDLDGLAAAGEAVGYPLLVKASAGGGIGMQRADTPDQLEEVARKTQSMAAAVALAVQERYRGAGTVEFVLDADSGDFFFLEMNTRIQVEHPVTEMITGVDLVALQLRLAAGEDLSAVTQQSIERSGHAIECRLYAENPDRNFLPSPGRLETFSLPEGLAGTRLDSGVRAGDQITFYYDPMIAKLICHGADRGQAIERSVAALQATALEGLVSNTAFLLRCLQQQAFVAGDTHTGFIDQHKAELIAV